jgi:hypothetical protein
MNMYTYPFLTAPAPRCTWRYHSVFFLAALAASSSLAIGQIKDTITLASPVEMACCGAKATSEPIEFDVTGLPESLPSIVSAMTRRIDKEFAEVTLTFALPVGAKEAPPEVLPIISNGRTLMFKRGKDDRQYTGIIEMTEDELEHSMQILKSAPPETEQLIFRDRHVAGKTTAGRSLEMLAKLREGGEIDILKTSDSFSRSLLKDAESIKMPPPPPPPNDPCPTSWNGSQPSWQKTLWINDLSVVEDPHRTYDPATGNGTPGGVWTMGYLFNQIAASVNGSGGPRVTASDIARRWLREWEHNQVTNFDPTSERKLRMQQTILKTWELASGGVGAALDPNEAPFRLLAIVNRPDLRGGGYAMNALDNSCDPKCGFGEGRLIFGYCGSNRVKGSVTQEVITTPFLCIFEYCLPMADCCELREYQAQWANLETADWGADDYNPKLEQLTRRFTDAFAAPGRPFGSALSQLRTNELLLAPASRILVSQPSSDQRPFSTSEIGDVSEIGLVESRKADLKRFPVTRVPSYTSPRGPWELREFKLFSADSDAGYLRQVTTKQTPDFVNNVSNSLAANFATFGFPGDVPLEWLRVPSAQQAVPLLGGDAPVPSPAFGWGVIGAVTQAGWPQWAAGAGTDARHKFSLLTCNGCHGGETGTNFVHAAMRQFGQLSAPSRFLTGITLTTPGAGPTVSFNDFYDRERDLFSLLAHPCRDIDIIRRMQMNFQH